MQKNTPTSHPKDLAIPFTISMQIGCNTCSLLMFCFFSFRHVLRVFFGGGYVVFPKKNNFPCQVCPAFIHGGTRRKLQRSPKSRKRSASEMCIGKGCRVPVAPDMTEKKTPGVFLWWELMGENLQSNFCSKKNTYGVCDIKTFTWKNEKLYGNLM